MITSQKNKLNITWLGHSAFQLVTSNGKIVLLDPWLDNPEAPREIKDTISADIILVSHGHSDHLGNTIEIAKRTQAKVICIFEIYLFLQSKGISSAIGMNKGGTMDVDGIKITMTDAKHSSTIEDGAKILCGGEAAGFVVEFENGFKIYYAGDTSVFSDMKIIGELYTPDIAFLPIGDLYTMGPKEAAYACTLINPKFIIGMHYGTFPVLSGTPEALKKLLSPALRMKVMELEVGKSVGV
ncbi:MAG: metal-dependent hydrolase [Ignavibacteria bacterium]|nr:metal-dependent hydrolase [Ignavibacteria bacterium]